VITRAVFQAGLSWRAIDAAWDAYERAFAAFDPRAVAAFGDDDIERILADGGVLRSRKKIVATVANARALTTIVNEFGDVGAYLRSFSVYGELAADLRERFAFVGELSAYYVVFRLGGEVPRFETWETTIRGDHPRMREMIAHARANGWPG
jgi:hypothetical protein